MRYTEKEDKLIKKHAGKITTSQIASLLGRTRASVAQRANALGVQLKQVGQHHYNSKLTEADVEMIIKLDWQGIRGSAIHRKHFSHVSRTTIYDILECKTWRHK